MDDEKREEEEEGILVESERWVGGKLGRGQNAWTWIRSSRVSREGGGDDVDYREKGAEVFSLFSYIYIWMALRMLPRQEYAFLDNAKRIFFELVGFPRNPNKTKKTRFIRVTCFVLS